MIEPYYDQDGITIFNADCRDVLPTLDLSIVDLALTDPPYGIALANHGRADGRRTDRDWTIIGDESQTVGQSVLDMLAEHRIPRMVFASPKAPWAGSWRQHLVWDKGPAVGGGGDIATCWKFTWELIQVADTPPLRGKRDESVLRFAATPLDSIDHPAQKPEPLLRYLIAKASPEGGVIVDPFMGSGSTLRAAKDLGRKAIGIEISEAYCRIAVDRLQQSVLPLEVESA